MITQICCRHVDVSCLTTGSSTNQTITTKPVINGMSTPIESLSVRD